MNIAIYDASSEFEYTTEAEINMIYMHQRADLHDPRMKYTVVKLLSELRLLRL